MKRLPFFFFCCITQEDILALWGKRFCVYFLDLAEVRRAETVMQHSALFDLCLSEEGFLEAGEKSGSSMMEWAITAGSILNPGSTNIV